MSDRATASTSAGTPENAEGAAMPSRIWAVVLPSGERFFLVREPLGGLDEYMRGFNATVAEYRLDRVLRSRTKPKVAAGE